MYTYTFPHEHFSAIMSHMSGLRIVVSNLTLHEEIYTMICQTQIEIDQYLHMNEVFNLMESI